ncbi:MAG TPA: RNA polymerase sigma factor [Anaerolineaceae bacterium]|nr:RNA polymerase sigma factor [Anaerolineaceae bacterium]
MTESIPFLEKAEVDQADEALIVREAQRAPARFRPLYLKWVTPIYRYLYYRLGNPQDAEDLTAQVFLKAYQQLPRYGHRGPFSAWLYAIARNTARDYFRKHRVEAPLEAGEPASESLDLLAQAIHTDELRRLDRLIRSLPEADQELIRLRFVAELSYREMGVLLNHKEDAVRKSVSRLLARLSRQMEAGHE